MPAVERVGSQHPGPYPASRHGHRSRPSLADPRLDDADPHAPTAAKESNPAVGIARDVANGVTGLRILARRQLNRNIDNGPIEVLADIEAIAGLDMRSR